ncbi:hypothetical protein DAVIS_02359 [Mycobacterium marinum]|uniref:Uncharacterized protein n=1 Tax=Mycobacterium marinum TaxID=1781 RepID=A0A3E2MWR0_MYCMR|nr:hypothetical protein DAVIS_02359 [Mycobacterium marinum]
MVADLDHHARALPAQRRGLPGVHPQHHEHIPEIDPRRGHRHPHLPRPERRLRLWVRLHHHAGERAFAACGQPPLLVGGEDEGFLHRGKTRRVHPSGTHHELGFFGGQQPRQVDHGSIGVDQDDPAGVFGLC